MPFWDAPRRMSCPTPLRIGGVPEMLRLPLLQTEVLWGDKVRAEEWKAAGEGDGRKGEEWREEELRRKLLEAAVWPILGFLLSWEDERLAILVLKSEGEGEEGEGLKELEEGVLVAGEWFNLGFFLSNSCSCLDICAKSTSVKSV